MSSTTAEVIELHLPYPPSLNSYWRTFRGRMIVSAAGRQYRADVLGALLGRRVVAPASEVAVEVDLHPPDRRRRDVDNTLKALLDAICAAGVCADDSLIGDLHVTRLNVVKDGCVVVHQGTPGRRGVGLTMAPIEDGQDMKKITTTEVDTRLGEALDRLTGALDSIACRAVDLGPAERARLVEMLVPIADQLHAIGVAVKPEVTPIRQ